MKTIEERAKEIRNIEHFTRVDAQWGMGHEIGYIRGATEQRKIDIEKACEWMKEYVNDYGYLDDGRVDTKEMIKGFRKAMEV